MRTAVLTALAAIAFCANAQAQKHEHGLEFSIIEEAWQASFGALVSGRGRGTYRQYIREGDGDWGIDVDSRVVVYFDDGKYHLQFEYSKSPKGENKRIIIYDGTAIFATRFSDGISVTGAETQAFPAPTTPGRPAKPELAHFPWDVTKLYSPLANIPAILKAYTPGSITLTTTAAGDYITESAARNSARVRIVKQFAREYGYNIASVQVYNDGNPGSSTTAEWKQDKGIWFVSKLTEEFTLKHRNRSWRQELSYDEFEVNAEVDPALFTMNALEMPGGSRLIDHRPAVPREKVIHYVPVENQEIEAKLDSMVEQLESLPTTRTGTRMINPAEDGRGLRFWLILGFNLLIAGLVIVLLIWRRRRRKSAPSASQ
ncbi:MAG: hypothetical protein KY476_00050 [Planctomycetes bacterium]|nr:hypothetical protein [Planctomycetota bacterium]